jgi:ABC-type dipeptide/oligopeptide/nickel transport system permease subunit
MPPGIPELGNIMSSEGLQYMRAAPWILWRPALTLVVLITVWVMTGDSLLERLGFRSKAIWAKTME